MGAVIDVQEPFMASYQLPNMVLELHSDSGSFVKAFANELRYMLIKKPLAPDIILHFNKFGSLLKFDEELVTEFTQTYKGARWQCTVYKNTQGAYRLHVQSNKLGQSFSAKIILIAMAWILYNKNSSALIHGSCMVHQQKGRSLIMTGESGIGKSSLMLSFVMGENYSWISDDVSIIGAAGVSGLSFPVLLRGYGKLPVDVKFEFNVRFARLLKKGLFYCSFKKINLFTDIKMASKRALNNELHNMQESVVVFLEKGESLTQSTLAPLEMAKKIVNNWRAHNNPVLEAVETIFLAESSQSFWDEQVNLLTKILNDSTLYLVTVIDDIKSNYHFLSRIK